MHSNLIFCSYGYRSVAIFRVNAAERQTMLLTLWKDLRSEEKVVVLALWSCASLHPRVLQWSCTQFLSWCLVCWAGSERFASARFQLRSRRQRGLHGHLSFDLRELCLAWEAWKFVSDLENLRCNAGSNTLCGFWRYVRILPDDFSLRRFLANFSVWHELLDLFFVISETKAFRQGKESKV